MRLKSLRKHCGFVAGNNSLRTIIPIIHMKGCVWPETILTFIMLYLIGVNDAITCDTPESLVQYLIKGCCSYYGHSISSLCSVVKMQYSQGCRMCSSLDLHWQWRSYLSRNSEVLQVSAFSVLCITLWSKVILLKLNLKSKDLKLQMIYNLNFPKKRKNKCICFRFLPR